MMQSTPMYGQKQMPPGYPQAPGAARNAHQQQQLQQQQQQQQRHASFPAAGGAGGGAQLPASAMQKLLDMERTVKKWEGILKELTEAVFVVCATVMTDNLPYYSELPTSEADLRLPTGTLANNTKVTLIYPQYPPPNLGLLFMRVRFCDPSTSAINQCFVPVANMKLQPQQVYALTGINSSESQYLNYFHNPGEADPNPNSSQNLLMHRLAALEAAAGLSSAAGDEQLYTE